MTKWRISYYGHGRVENACIEAPTAADALTMFDANVKRNRLNKSSAGPTMYDVANIEVLSGDVSGDGLGGSVEELLRIEWAGCAYEGSAHLCPSCGHDEEGDPGYTDAHAAYAPGTHLAGCSLDAELTKAGLPDVTSRCAARARLGPDVDGHSGKVYGGP